MDMDNKFKVAKTGKDSCMKVAKWSVAAFSAAVIGGIAFSIAEDRAVSKIQLEEAEKLKKQLKDN